MLVWLPYFHISEKDKGSVLAGLKAKNACECVSGSLLKADPTRCGESLVAVERSKQRLSSAVSCHDCQYMLHAARCTAFVVELSRFGQGPESHFRARKERTCPHDSVYWIQPEHSVPDSSHA